MKMVYASAAAGALLWLNGCRSESDELRDWLRKEVTTKFHQAHSYEALMKEFDPQHLPEFFSSVAGKDANWRFVGEDVEFAGIDHTPFPFVAVHKLRLAAENPKALCEVNELFIYSMDYGEWLPLSRHALNVKDGKIDGQTTRSLWDKDNDWVETIRKNHDPDLVYKRLEEYIGRTGKDRVKIRERLQHRSSASFPCTHGIPKSFDRDISQVQPVKSFNDVTQTGLGWVK
jgi:hypothetical protein